MTRIDRLSTLLSRFQMSVVLAPSGEGNLLILASAESGQPSRIVFKAEGQACPIDRNEIVLAGLFADWGGQTNPLITEMTKSISLPIGPNDETDALVKLLLSEAKAKRCGVDSVLSRLGEIIFVQLIRSEIERGTGKTGLLAGLADKRISKTIVAMHENPGRSWRNNELASIAGLSLSRFADIFLMCVGHTPQAYLRKWRMTLAHQDLERGDRIKAVSRRYGYASSEALGRAFQRQFGKLPLSVRRNVSENVLPH